MQCGCGRPHCQHGIALRQQCPATRSAPHLEVEKDDFEDEKADCAPSLQILPEQRGQTINRFVKGFPKLPRCKRVPLASTIVLVPCEWSTVVLGYVGGWVRSCNATHQPRRSPLVWCNKVPWLCSNKAIETHGKNPQRVKIFPDVRTA